MWPYKMDVKFLGFLFLLSFGSSSCSVIIPEELPSLLSVAYSNIPPIKKGNDHRIGFGFAFGNHADFQVLLELGPQTNTMNLTGEPFPSGAGASSAAGSTKRQAPAPPAPAPHAGANNNKVSSSAGGKYLQQWAQQMKRGAAAAPPARRPRPRPRPGDVPNLEDAMVELVKNDKGEYEIHQPSPGNLPPHILHDLKRLYGYKTDEPVKAAAPAGDTRTAEEVKKITDDLSNVDLD